MNIIYVNGDKRRALGRVSVIRGNVKLNSYQAIVELKLANLSFTLVQCWFYMG